MGFFDFLKTKSKPIETVQQVRTDRPECDISKTHTMVELFQVRAEARDENWTNLFFETVQTASFACGDPQVFTGPDGFPYFALHTPEPDKAFESFCIRNMKDDFLLDQGWGVVLNPKATSADWVFSYGDILNLHLNNEFFSTTNNLVLEKEGTGEKQEETLIAQPSEAYLPQRTRALLKKFLQSIGLKRPKVILVCRANDGEVVQQLGFNIFAEDFPDREQFEFRLQQISWFLPKHYALVLIPKNSDLIKSFSDL